LLTQKLKNEFLDKLHFPYFLKGKLPATADSRVLEVNTQRLRPSQALELLVAIAGKGRCIE